MIIESAQDEGTIAVFCRKHRSPSDQLLLFSLFIAFWCLVFFGFKLNFSLVPPSPPPRVRKLWCGTKFLLSPPLSSITKGCRQHPPTLQRLEIQSNYQKSEKIANHQKIARKTWKSSIFWPHLVSNSEVIINLWILYVTWLLIVASIF